MSETVYYATESDEFTEDSYPEGPFESAEAVALEHFQQNDVENKLFMQDTENPKNIFCCVWKYVDGKHVDPCQIWRPKSWMPSGYGGLEITEVERKPND